jgi:glycosyltransferase involved in cell wall biosynthesis
MRDPEVLVLLPAWNEEETVAAVLDEIRALGTYPRVLVVDDGSTDATSQVAKAAGATVLTLPINLGVGGALRAGYRWGLRHGFTCVVQLDSDGQHDPRDISAVLAPVLDGELDLAIGARFAGVGDYEQAGLRRLVMRMLSAIISTIVGTKLTDTTSGFKAASLRAMTVFAQDFPMEYLGDTVEALIIGHKAGLRIGQVGVTMRERQGGSPSHDSWRSGVFLLRALLATAVATTRRATKVGTHERG